MISGAAPSAATQSPATKPATTTTTPTPTTSTNQLSAPGGLKLPPPKLELKMPEVPLDDQSAKGGEADRAALFAQLNQGENITSSIYFMTFFS